MRAIIVSIVAIVLISAPAAASAVGLAVAPSELSLTGTAGRATVAEMKVTNTSKSAALFEAYPEDFRALIEVYPETFVLEGGGSRTVTVTVTAREPGHLTTAIAVTASPMAAKGFQAGAGIKVPLRADLSAAQTGLLASAADALGPKALPVGAALAASALFLRYFKISRRRPGEEKAAS